METFEIEQQETVTRQEAATRLRRIANLLSGDEDEAVFERGGMRFEVRLPDELNFKVEFEVGTEERELEIELKW
jgi:amphi-Trp domain-containing protein